MSNSDVYKFCSSIERLKNDLKSSGGTERITSVRPRDVDNLMKACKICDVQCTKLGVVKEKVSFHGGDYEVEKEKVKINL